MRRSAPALGHDVCIQRKPQLEHHARNGGEPADRKELLRRGNIESSTLWPRRWKEGRRRSRRGLVADWRW